MTYTMQQIRTQKELFPVSIKNMNEVISEIIFGESELGEEMQEESMK